jgi:hypothetical protein
MRNLNGKNEQKQSGFVLIFLALAIAVLLGFTGLAIDASRHMAIHAELQTAADSCALSAVNELNAAPDSLLRATEVGKYVGGYKNKKNFQSEIVEIQGSDIKFSSTLEGVYEDANSANYTTAAFVECKTFAPNIINIFLKFLNIENSDLSAAARATTIPSQSLCTLPIAAFAKNNSDAVNFGYSKGDIINLSKTSSDVTGGFFTWADTSGTLGTTSLSPYVQKITQYGQCDVNAVSRCIDIKTGAIASLEDAWNSRFGLYKNGSGSLQPQSAIPDISGYGYRLPGNSAVNAPPTGGALMDYLVNRVNTRASFQSTIPGYNIPANIHINYGASTRRLSSIAVLSTSNSCGGTKRTLIGWACVFMLAPKSSSQDAQVEYEGNASSQNSACRAFGTPGGESSNGPLVAVLIQ